MKRIYVTQTGVLSEIPERWFKDFLMEAAREIIANGRYTELMQRISGMTVEQLTGVAFKNTQVVTNGHGHAPIVKEKIVEGPVEVAQDAAQKVSDDKSKNVPPVKKEIVMRHNFDD